ncbi:MAG: nucleotidyltransferase family protein, partial [Deltaproteobacteria bacterium]
PKPACPVLDRPLVWYGLALLSSAGVREVIVNSHHLPERMEDAAREGARRLGLSLELSRETELLGTGGGLARAAPVLRGGTFLLLNGDVLFDVDLPAALRAHQAAQAAATMVVRPMPEGASYRPIHVREDGTVARIAGDEPPPERTAPRLFTGVHVLEPEILSVLPEGPSGLHEQGYGPLLASGRRVIAHADHGWWDDLGTPHRYLRANLAAARGELPLGRFAALGELAPAESFIARDAQVAGRVEGSVIGSRARVPAGASATRSLLWPDTELGPDEALTDAIAAGPLRIQA